MEKLQNINLKHLQDKKDDLEWVVDVIIENKLYKVSVDEFD